jgi:hypothetical protein
LEKDIPLRRTMRPMRFSLLLLPTPHSQTRIFVFLSPTGYLAAKKGSSSNQKKDDDDDDISRTCFSSPHVLYLEIVPFNRNQPKTKIETALSGKINNV